MSEETSKKKLKQDVEYIIYCWRWQYFIRKPYTQCILYKEQLSCLTTSNTHY